jgi:hypothetical protein
MPSDLELQILKDIFALAIPSPTQRVVFFLQACPSPSAHLLPAQSRVLELLFDALSQQHDIHVAIRNLVASCDKFQSPLELGIQNHLLDSMASVFTASSLSECASGNDDKKWAFLLCLGVSESDETFTE